MEAFYCSKLSSLWYREPQKGPSNSFPSMQEVSTHDHAGETKSCSLVCRASSWVGWFLIRWLKGRPSCLDFRWPSHVNAPSLPVSAWQWLQRHGCCSDFRWVNCHLRPGGCPVGLYKALCGYSAMSSPVVCSFLLYCVCNVSPEI